MAQLHATANHSSGLTKLQGEQRQQHVTVGQTAQVSGGVPRLLSVPEIAEAARAGVDSRLKVATVEVRDDVRVVLRPHKETEHVSLPKGDPGSRWSALVDKHGESCPMESQTG